MPDTRLPSITVNGRFLSQRITGVQRYALELLNALDILLTERTIEHVPVTVLVPRDVKDFPSWSSIRVKQVGRFTGQLWEQTDLPWHSRGTVLLTACGGAPVLHPRNVFTIHDAGPFRTPNAYTFAYRTYYQALERILSFAGAHIITISEFSRDELVECLRISPEQITVTLLSAEHILRCKQDETILGKHALETGRYVLAVGSRNPNKNLRGLMLASTYLPPSGVDFVITGGANSSIFSESQKFPDSLKDLGFVTDAELRSLYENAACFVFPSFYEGFGLPPLEALTLGCPVVVARAASLPEIFGDAAVYCDPHSPQDIALQISRVLEGNHPTREAMLGHAAQFTWERCARETWAALLRAL